MRSLNVVLPASMCAITPKLRKERIVWTSLESFLSDMAELWVEPGLDIRRLAAARIAARTAPPGGRATPGSTPDTGCPGWKGKNGSVRVRAVNGRPGFARRPAQPRR